MFAVRSPGEHGPSHLANVLSPVLGFLFRKEVAMNPVTMNVPPPAACGTPCSVLAEGRGEAPANASADSATAASQAAPEGSSPAKPVRGEHGRWLQGNPGGAGNPFARQVAAVRQRLYDRITPE